MSANSRFQQEAERVRREQTRRPGRTSLLSILIRVTTVEEAKERLRFFAPPTSGNLCWALNQLKVPTEAIPARWSAALTKQIFCLYD